MVRARPPGIRIHCRSCLAPASALIRAGGTLTVRHSYPGTILLMPVLLYFLLLCKSSKERCPRPFQGESECKGTHFHRNGQAFPWHFFHIFSGKRRNLPLAAGKVNATWQKQPSQVAKRHSCGAGSVAYTERNYRKLFRNLWWFPRARTLFI